MKLSIVIVSWNVKYLLQKCLESIYKNSPNCDLEVIVVDNASSDGSAEAAEEWFKVHGSRFTVIKNQTNLGFSTANNQGIKTSSGEYVLILNPDTETQPGALDILLSFLESDEDAAAAAPKLLNPDMTLQKSVLGFPTLGAMAMRQLFIEQLWPGNPYTKKYLMSDFKYDRAEEIDQPMGAAIMIKRAVLDKVGLFDESSFMFFDEVDLCFRIKNSGLKLYFIPEATIIHHGGVSIRKWGALNLSRHWTRSRNLFFRKNYGTMAIVILYLIDAARVAVILTLLASIAVTIKMLLFR